MDSTNKQTVSDNLDYKAKLDVALDNAKAILHSECENLFLEIDK